MPTKKTRQPTQKPNADSSVAKKSDDAGERECGRVLAGPVPEHGRRDGEDGADRLGEPLRRPGRVAMLHRQPRRDDPGGEQAERAQLRAGERAGEEAVREHGQEPALLECDRHDGEHGDDARDEPCGRLVDRVREREEVAHNHPKYIVSVPFIPRARPRPLPRVRRSRLSARVAARCARRSRTSARISSARLRASSRARSACPWRGRAGQTLRRWLELDEEAFYATFYCASVTRCYPGRAPSGRGDRTPAPRERELCAFWHRWELELLRPRLVVTVGGLALREVLGLTDAHRLHRRDVRARRRPGHPAAAPVRREQLAERAREPRAARPRARARP